MRISRIQVRVKKKQKKFPKKEKAIHVHSISSLSLSSFDHRYKSDEEHEKEKELSIIKIEMINDSLCFVEYKISRAYSASYLKDPKNAFCFFLKISLEELVLIWFFFPENSMGNPTK